MSDPIAWLETHGAQNDVLTGLRAIARDWRELWTGCPRGDWLLGIAEKVGVDQTHLLKAAVDCASLGLDHLDPSARAKAEAVLEAARKGTSVTEALAAFESIKIQDPAAEAASRAILAVGMGITDREVLVSAPAGAAEAEIMSTIDCGLDLATRWAHDNLADRVRAAIPWNVVEPLVAKL